MLSKSLMHHSGKLWKGMGCVLSIQRNNLLNPNETSTSLHTVLIQKLNLSHKLCIQQEETNKPTKLKNKTEQEFLVKLKNNPDIFGSYDLDIPCEDDKQEDEFLENKVLPSQKLSTKQYADIIKFLVKERRIKEAIDVLEVKMLKEDQVKPENYIYNLLLGACGRVGYTKKAFSLYNNMKKRGLEVTPGTYTALFNACANSPWPSTDGLTRAKHLRNIMQEKMHEPNDTNYNAMIKAFGRCGDLTTAFQLVDEMSSKKMKINNDTFNFLLQACITDKEAGFRHALLVWRKIIDKKINPNIFTYNLMLRSIRDCNLGDLRVTQDVLSKILKEPLKIDESQKLIISDKHLPINNSLTITNQQELSLVYENLNPNLMAVSPHLGNLISVSEVMKPEEKLVLVGGMNGFLEHMKCSKCEPDIKTFTQLLSCIPNTEAAENELLSTMKRYNIRFDIDFFNMLIRKKSMRFDYENAKKVLKTISKYKMRPNLITFGVLALGCKTKNEATELLSQMKESKYRLNAEILGTMLKQACHHKNFPYVMEMMETCITEGIQPNKKFIEHLDEFKRLCRKIIKDKTYTVEKSNQFQTDFQTFRSRYKQWLTKVNLDETEDVHPWQQFKEETDANTDKYYKDREATSRFKPRHVSKFKVRTSAKYTDRNKM